ncbi:uncharacterized protein HD556DRAFT_1242511, partial [Suillus plorans]
MSSHYNLRSQRSATLNAEQTIPGTLVESPLTEVSTNDATPTPSPTERSFSRLGDSVLRPARSYSDVVQTRSDTPQPEAGVRSASVDSAITGRRQSTGVVENWNDEPVNNPFPKTKGQIEPDLVREAEKYLTQEEKQRISDRRRLEERARVSDQTSSSPDEGPSKGKGADPRNWGNANLDGSEVDLEAQREALATWTRSKEWAQENPREQTDSEEDRRDPVQAAIRATEKRITEQFEHQIHQLKERLREADKLTRDKTKVLPSRSTVRKTSDKENRHPVREMVEKAASQPARKHGLRETPPAMDAAAQIAPKSYLGRAFESMTQKKGKGAKPTRVHFPDDSSSDSSDSSTTTQSSSSELSSESEDSSSSSCDRGKRASKKRHKTKKRKTKRKTTLKPIPPKEYDGSVDPRAFHRFITEGTAYVEDGNVPRGRRVFVLSYYLKGKAHDFYVRQVSDRPGEWRLKEFFTELFNYCFPLDFRTKQRKKLYRCYQGDQRVRDYLSELNELWMMIGNVPEREKVVKFWFGLSASIQNELYKMQLNPEVSSLSEVQRIAEIIELAESAVSNGRGREEGPKAPKKQGKDPKGHGQPKGEAPRGSDKGNHGQRDKQSSGSSRRDRVHRPAQSKRSERPKDEKMSREEHDRLVSEGRCFICKEAGHMSRQCPKRITVPSTHKDKPPGVPNYAMHIE